MRSISAVAALQASRRATEESRWDERALRSEPEREGSEMMAQASLRVRARRSAERESHERGIAEVGAGAGEVEIGRRDSRRRIRVSSKGLEEGLRGFFLE